MTYLYLKLWPVHVHAGAMVVAEPLEIFLRAGWRDGAFKVSVYCDIAAKNQQRLSAWMTITSYCRSVAFFLNVSNLWFSARLRWHLTSSSTSLRKLSLFSSNCWHWSNTCSMFSMYWGVHLLSSSRAFSYFSFAWDVTQTQGNIMEKEMKCCAISHWCWSDWCPLHVFLLFISLGKKNEPC